ncbi:hypothetical protein FHJ30_01085 [Arthrobacter sp. BB-1]|uniref:hypothetical protein n=1 Tax=unclassified Arthrobacter TaxID=235627 RepID=UPI0010EC747E|nr:MULTISPECIES: hypothetical protein [unclassified Arthrobacter]TNB76744.1 hypothetical protein FHJ30_01085 [Arthrobacter sp. BB-1]VII96463.1 hypothetical protein [Arthrobacter sp. DR-2P]
MADDQVSENVPSDEHLRQDVAPEAGGEPQDAAPQDAAPQGAADRAFTPGQTNAGQQVAGLASASGYGKDLDPEAEPDGNNPV